MNSQPRVSILAIGTELTSGQIVNRNASWISARLSRIGVQTSGHWTVPDDRPLIQKALDLAAETSDFIFVTGGLGPTTDDFTRDMIAEWTGLPMEWDENSWQAIVQRFAARGMKTTEIQKQQCYFPKGSSILGNSQGTANGFRVVAKNKTFLVLPGPPREIEAIWNEHLEAWLPSQFPNLDPWITRSWETIGQGESAIAELTEKALAGANFEKGYRVHVPFVEVKLSFAKSRQAEAAPWIEKVTQALAPYTVLRDGDDVAAKLARALDGFSRVVLIDEISGEYFWNRLLPFFTKAWREKGVVFANRPVEVGPDTLLLRLQRVSPNEARATLKFRGYVRSANFLSTYATHLLKERERQFFAENAGLFWARELESLS